MRYKGRELRRLWDISVYVGDPDDKKRKIRSETIVAFNAVEAIRFCGGQASAQPRAMYYVTWPEDKSGVGPIHRIEDTSGPMNDIPVQPSIALRTPPSAPVEEPRPVEDAPAPKVKRVRFKSKA